MRASSPALERLVLRGLARAGIGNHLGHLNHVRWQSATANVILSDEFQQCSIPKLVPAFELPQQDES
jgi:hypothetical protein